MRQQPLLVMKPDDVRAPGDIATQHALDTPPRTFVVTQGKQRHADQTVADRPVATIGGFRRLKSKFLCKRQRRPVASSPERLSGHYPKSSQPIIPLVDAFPH